MRGLSITLGTFGLAMCLAEYRAVIPIWLIITICLVPLILLIVAGDYDATDYDPDDPESLDHPISPARLRIGTIACTVAAVWYLLLALIAIGITLAFRPHGWLWFALLLVVVGAWEPLRILRYRLAC